MMRRRITFIVPKDAPPVSPENFAYDGKALKIKSITATRQDRVTLSLEQLPTQIADILARFAEARIRWTSPLPHKDVEPFVSHLPPGLHLFVKRKDDGLKSEDLCEALDQELKFLLNCKCAGSPVSLPNGYDQTHAPISDPSHFIDILQHKLCEHFPKETHEHCIWSADLLQSASSFDIDFVEASKEFKITALWDRNKSSPSKLWDLTLMELGKNARVEVGVMDQRKAIEKNEIQLGGIVGVLGQSSELKPVLFSFASRHHHANATYEVDFQQPTGLHPKLKLQLEGPALSKPPGEDCSLNAYFTLPKFLFIDKYQLSDPQFLASIGLKRLVGVYGETDLEAPTWTQKPWGSTFLLELSGGSTKKSVLPLHTRYIEPADGDNQSIGFDVPWPTLFYACPPDFPDPESPPEKNPFDRTALGYEHFFEENTIFHHLSPKGESLLAPIALPTLGLKHAELIKTGTIGAVLLGFLFVVVMILSSLRKSKPDVRKKKE